jgi:hypothetical protein
LAELALRLDVNRSPLDPPKFLNRVGDNRPAIANKASPAKCRKNIVVAVLGHE